MSFQACLKMNAPGARAQKSWAQKSMTSIFHTYGIVVVGDEKQDFSLVFLFYMDCAGNEALAADRVLNPT